MPRSGLESIITVSIILLVNYFSFFSVCLQMCLCACIHNIHIMYNLVSDSPPQKSLHIFCSPKGSFGHAVH